MRVIDRKWTELAAGYQAIRSLQAKLESEFNRAVEIGYQQQYSRDVAAWQKKRRIFFAFVIIAPLSIIGLCLSAYYYREVACVIIYWVLLVLVILVTLGVATRNYITEMMNKPKLGNAVPAPMALEKHWWETLAPAELALTTGIINKVKPDFLDLLTDLPDTTLARRGPLVEGADSLYVFGPSGPWIFTIRDWTGDIIRQDDTWKEVSKRSEPVTFAQPPDTQWVELKDALASILNERYPLPGGQIHGGVVFINPKVHLYKDLIKGNLAAYGQANAWINRLSGGPVVEGLSLESEMEILDALIAREKAPGEPLDLAYSAKELATRLYQQAVTELRSFVARMVDQRVDRASASR